MYIQHRLQQSHRYRRAPPGPANRLVQILHRYIARCVRHTEMLYSVGSYTLVLSCSKY
jgi:hypothetical protein